MITLVLNRMERYFSDSEPIFQHNWCFIEAITQFHLFQVNTHFHISKTREQLTNLVQ